LRGINVASFAACADHVVGGAEWSTLTHDAFPARKFDFMLSNPLYGKVGRKVLRTRPGDMRPVTYRLAGECGTGFPPGFTSAWRTVSKYGDPKYVPAACREIDKPIATLLKDLKQRGLLDTTLLACVSEFGRTAITHGKNLTEAGRDHHPHAFSVFLAGGGVKGGLTHGSTDDFGWKVATDGVHLHDFNATLLHLFGLDHKKLTFRHQGLDKRLTDVAGNVVTKILK
jgi:hypothetical protein